MAEIPRRLSVHDADYDHSVGARLAITLDGIDQAGRVEAYDIDAGTVTRCKHDEHGDAFVVDDEIAMETVTGAVEVNWKA